MPVILESLRLAKHLDEPLEFERLLEECWRAADRARSRGYCIARAAEEAVLLLQETMDVCREVLR